MSAEEREAFINADAFGAMRLGKEYSKRTPIVPPRHASVWLVIDALPVSVIAALFVAGFTAWLFARQAQSAWIAALCWFAVLLLGSAGLAMAGRRLLNGRQH